MNNRLEKYKKELEIAGYLNSSDEYTQEIGNCALQLLETITKQRHSGFSFYSTINVFNKLVNDDILTPLTGEDDEWNLVEFGDNNVYTFQNKRRSSVMKDHTGEAYDVDGGPIYEDKNGCTYTDRTSILRNIKFPYIPEKRQIIKKDT